MKTWQDLRRQDNGVRFRMWFGEGAIQWQTGQKAEIFRRLTHNEPRNIDAHLFQSWHFVPILVV